MATKRFIIEVEEGKTNSCKGCPLYPAKRICSYFADDAKCDNLNLATMKIKEMEEEK